MQGSLQGKRILLVEDNSDIQAFVSTVMRLEGAQLTAVATGEDSLEELRNPPLPDLVVLDLNLPGIQGWDVLAEIQSLETDWRPPVVVFSAYTDLPTRERAEEMGAVGFLAKPIGARELVEQIKAVL